MELGIDCRHKYLKHLLIKMEFRIPLKGILVFFWGNFRRCLRYLCLQSIPNFNTNNKGVRMYELQASLIKIFQLNMNFIRVLKKKNNIVLKSLFKIERKV